MSIQFVTQGEIVNQLTVNNNLENREFMFQVQWTPTGTNVEWTFSIIDPPGTLMIDTQTALITGNLLSLEKNSKKGQDILYPEYDYREFGDRRPAEDYYPFSFKVVVNGSEVIGNSTVPFYAETTLVINIIKDQSANVLTHQKQFLDGHEGRAPFTCVYQKPMTQEHCSQIGGEWDEEYQECSINIPRNQSDCSQIGGEWKGGECDVSMIDNQSHCESQGYKWVKNSIKGQETYQEFLDDNSFEVETIAIQTELL